MMRNYCLGAYDGDKEMYKDYHSKTQTLSDGELIKYITKEQRSGFWGVRAQAIWVHVLAIEMEKRGLKHSIKIEVREGAVLFSLGKVEDIYEQVVKK